MIIRKCKREGCILLSAIFIFSSFFILQFDQSWAASTGSWSETSYTIKQGNVSLGFKSLTNSGDSTLITVKDSKSGTTKYILVDTGGKSTNIASKIKGKTLDYVILTHNHGDHTRGLTNFIANNVKIKSLFYNYQHSTVTKINDPSGTKTVSLGGLSTYEYVKKYQSSLLTTSGHATRVRDAENHSTDASNSNLTGKMRIRAGKVYKLRSIAEDGYDLIIVPPITNRTTGAWAHSNNESMMVVLQTDNHRVIFGGDIMMGATECINDLDNSPEVVKNSSYYNGIKKYIYDNGKYTLYKVSHHGTGSDRVIGSARETAERKLLSKMGADVLIMTGYNDSSAKYEYYKHLCNNQNYDGSQYKTQVKLGYKYFNNRFPRL